MTQAIIYKLTSNSWAKAFPKVIEGVFNKGNKIFINAKKEAVGPLDDLLWSFEQLSFLPHSTTSDQEAKEQSILIGDDFNPINDAKVLAVTDSKVPTNFDDFEKIISVYDQANISEMGGFIKQLEDNSIKYTVYQQNGKGAWEKSS